MTGSLGLAHADTPPVPLPSSLEPGPCYAYCEALVRARHNNYPIASMFARPQLRKHIFAVFAFARVADDIADEIIYEGRRARELDRWDEMLNAAYRGRADHPVFVALADTVDQLGLPITEFSDLLSGFRTDLERRRYATFTELRSYIQLAAEPLGRLFLYVAGCRTPELHVYASELSTAVAVARMLQDISTDWRRGRVYLPAEDLRHFGVTELDIAGRRVTRAVEALVRYEAARTRALFEHARPIVELAPDDLAVDLALTWHGGMRMLDKIAATAGRLFADRPELDRFDKALVLTRSLAWRGRSLDLSRWLGPLALTARAAAVCQPG
jgi:squalene synthase HpnC